METGIDKRTKEALRYMGIGRHTPDGRTLTMVYDAFAMLEASVSKKHVSRMYPLIQEDDGTLGVLHTTIKSRALCKNMKGCQEIILFGATLGPAPDRLMKRYSITDMAMSVTLQAASAAMLEEYCDEICDRLSARLEEQGRYLRPRFSPGYGDFPITYQRELTALLDTPRQIGLTITDSCMMSPTKSVTAVIGVSQTRENCHRHGCEVCPKTDCAFRRDT